MSKFVSQLFACFTETGWFGTQVPTENIDPETSYNNPNEIIENENEINVISESGDNNNNNIKSLENRVESTNDTYENKIDDNWGDDWKDEDEDEDEDENIGTLSDDDLNDFQTTSYINKDVVVEDKNDSKKEILKKEVLSNENNEIKNEKQIVQEEEEEEEEDFFADMAPEIKRTKVLIVPKDVVEKKNPAIEEIDEDEDFNNDSKINSKFLLDDDDDELNMDNDVWGNDDIDDEIDDEIITKSAKSDKPKRNKKNITNKKEEQEKVQIVKKDIDFGDDFDDDFN